MEGIDSFETALGSNYKILPDGRTQRFRQVDGEFKNPQDIIVFVPPLSEIIDQAPPEVRSKLGKNQKEYQRILVGYAQKVDYPEAKVRIIGDGGKIFRTNQEVQSHTGRISLALMQNKNTVVLTIPVSKQPRIGYQPFDMSTRQLKNGTWETETHLGNPIVKINPILPRDS